MAYPPCNIEDRSRRVAARIRYNGHIHHRLAYLLSNEPRTEMTFFTDQLPRAYLEEHGVHQLTVKFETQCIDIDPSGEHGWICSEVWDLDEQAGWEMKTA